MKTDKAIQRRSSIAIMRRMVGLIRSLLPIMILAILFGVAGFLCAISLTVLATQALLRVLMEMHIVEGMPGLLQPLSFSTLLGVMLVFAVLRGILHYVEQYCNHFIAFKSLALIRHKVFAALRLLCPAKLEGKERGNLISVLTNDIELLEVFYAHTISPIAICLVVCLFLLAFFWQYHWSVAMLALLSYLVVGVWIPLRNGKRGAEAGLSFRQKAGDMNSLVLESLRGLEDIIAFDKGEERTKRIIEESDALSRDAKKLADNAGTQRALTSLIILLATFANLLLTTWLYRHGQVSVGTVVITTVALMGSFGPTVALSNLSNNLTLTLASGERVLRLLEEKPEVEEVPGGGDVDVSFEGMAAEEITFSYGSRPILEDFSLSIPPKQILGIHGPSGCGKSTLLKLLMRFWDVQKGRITLNEVDLRKVPGASLRKTQSYISQDTHLFKATIGENIALAKRNATSEEISEAAKKASLHDFIMSLPRGYDTPLAELGEGLSGGQRQRLGLARAFLQDGDLILLDEPTSNLDALNEGLILKTLKEEATSKTLVLVSHRESTLRIADTRVQMKS